jgi:hypothetical protein
MSEFNNSFFGQVLGYQKAALSIEREKQQIEDDKLTAQVKISQFKQKRLEDALMAQIDPTDEKSIAQGAKTLFQSGDSAGGMKLLEAGQKITDQKTMAKLHEAETAAKIREQDGGILQGMVDPISYKFGYDKLSEDIKGQLTGDPTVDLPKVQAMSMVLLSGKEALKNKIDMAREGARQRVEDEKERHNLAAEQRMNAGLAETIKKGNRLEGHWQEMEQDRRKKETMVQNGADLKFKAAVQKAATPGKNQFEQAQAIVDTDEATKEAPPEIKTAIVKMLAARASKEVASHLNKDDPTFTPDDYHEVLMTQLEESKKKKEIQKFVPGGWFSKAEGGYTPSKKITGPATAPIPPPKAPDKIPHISSDAEYAKLPSGALFISPDGSTRKKP